MSATANENIPRASVTANPKIRFEIIETNNPEIVCFKRSKAEDTIYFIGNLSESKQEFKSKVNGKLTSLNVQTELSLASGILEPWEFHFLKGIK